ncbi:hypothetical protein [Glaciimonas soli]|uniref:Lipoprotein n=1 Tax=Glaciimonas soli TaxID=2590999 RepID=A0A843YWT9_9BURK|nr:hypothetical protein [Glaciimonas soli]MQR01958.1 hypothetical protein [Glaciimonas soli]
MKNFTLLLAVATLLGGCVVPPYGPRDGGDQHGHYDDRGGYDHNDRGGYDRDGRGDYPNGGQESNH